MRHYIGKKKSPKRPLHFAKKRHEPLLTNDEKRELIGAIFEGLFITFMFLFLIWAIFIFKGV